jgi:hypothetical protein
LLFLIIPNRRDEPFSKPLAWAFDYGRELLSEPRSLVNFVGGVMLLVGTIPPFLRLTWWTIVPAIVCGAVYIGIGFGEAIYG